MPALSSLDQLIVVAYLALAVAIGAWVSRRASTDTTSYFVAGRGLPWWLAGTSMVATTFAADTPLWVTGTVAARGLAGNWFWWNMAIGHVLAAVYLARLWHRTGVITDAGVIEERYSGPEAAWLRGFKAFFFAVPLNALTMGWVILAMRKILAVFVDWAVLLPDGWFASLEAAWPGWVSFDAATGLSVAAAMGLAVLYSVLGGFRGVVLTDLMQFALGLVGAVAAAWYAVDAVGGLDALVPRLDAVTGDAASLLAWVPAADSAWMPLHLFATYLFVMWWAQKYSDAGGYMVQRMAACRDDRHATQATLWFVAAHYVVRSWPWILAALAALVLYPVADFPGLDREATYPMLLRDVLPPGLLGIAVASLIAAFMSTVDTHVNWGASYLVTDLYRRFWRKDASEAHYVRASRWAVVGMGLLAGIIAALMDSVGAAWKFFYALGSGLGMVGLARWLWWRVNAWSELASLGATGLITAVLSLGFPGLSFSWTVLWTMGGSAAVWIPATLLTRPVEAEVLDRFYRRVRPLGFWGPVAARCPEVRPAESPRRVLAAWGSGVAFVYLLLFGVGELLLGDRLLGGGLAALGLTAGGLTLHLALGVARAERAVADPRVDPAAG